MDYGTFSETNTILTGTQYLSTPTPPPPRDAWNIFCFKTQDLFMTLVPLRYLFKLENAYIP